MAKNKERTKITFWCNSKLADNVRDIVFWTNNMTVSKFMEEAVRAQVEAYQLMETATVGADGEVTIKKPGEPFPARTGDVKRGRPAGNS